MEYEIDKSLWHVCQICNKNIKDLAKELGGANTYYSEVFKKHLLEHSIIIEDYFSEVCRLKKPKCSCGCGGDVSINKKKSSNFKWKSFACGKNDGVVEWSKKAKETRKGKNNPMFGRESWNKGKTKDDDDKLKNISLKLTGRKIGSNTKNKQSKSAKVRKIHGHTGCSHTDENKEKFRQNALKMINDGKFSQLKSYPHKRMCEIIKSMNLAYEEEKRLSYWSFDIYLSDYDLYIEVDGDYFHSNPKIYPNGPKTNTQKINKARDDKKNKFVLDNNIKLIRFWESDILNDEKEVICRLKELLESKK